VTLFRDRQGLTKAARDRLISTTHVDYGYALAAIGRALGLHDTTISKVVKAQRGDNSRPDPHTPVLDSDPDFRVCRGFCPQPLEVVGNLHLMPISEDLPPSLLQQRTTYYECSWRNDPNVRFSFPWRLSHGRERCYNRHIMEGKPVWNTTKQRTS